MSDEQLYRQLRDGRKEAFEQLYARHEAALFRFAMHMTGSREAGEEIAHDVFVHLLEGRALYDERRGTLVAYLYGMARNLARTARRHPAPLEMIDQAVSAVAHDDVETQERTQALYAAMAEMPENFRDAVVLCDLEECSYDEAARRLDCPVGTVRSRVHRGRQFLAERLRPALMAAGGALARSEE